MSVEGICVQCGRPTGPTYGRNLCALCLLAPFLPADILPVPTVPGQWWIARKNFDDGRTGLVIPLTYGRARLTIGVGEHTWDDAW